MITRRQLLYFSALVSLSYPVTNIKYLAVAGEKPAPVRYPSTLNTLKKAYWAEIKASRHYDGYCQKALSEDYPNIAYIFSALSASEKIHADNYRTIIVSLDSSLEEHKIPVTVADTKTNLNTAAMNELEKINEFYPEIFEELSSESHDESVISCMYSWKSHQQHEELIQDIEKYSGVFFEPLAEEIENMDPNLYVCEICGSTLDEKPEIPCEICNHPLYHYKKLNRPVLLTGMLRDLRLF
ncbi:MAG TPA: ferritin family protein [Deltaproteobacteria bacterium]|mgnify:CR=1 FL=1|nr:ferritin family protein [Deltaproteobacteria bacterium]HPJ93090.1 ferritin family protein [Deltaproteobacteria bacterium]HPR52537.1 ferritin family protein [Deltaproteobacteria bacterium]